MICRVVIPPNDAGSSTCMTGGATTISARIHEGVPRPHEWTFHHSSAVADRTFERLCVIIFHYRRVNIFQTRSMTLRTRNIFKNKLIFLGPDIYLSRPMAKLTKFHLSLTSSLLYHIINSLSTKEVHLTEFPFPLEKDTFHK